MAVNPLSSFIDLAPGVPITAPPSQWQRECLMAAADGVVLLDQAQQPLGWLSLGRILMVNQGSLQGDGLNLDVPLGPGETLGTLPSPIASLLEPAGILAQTLSPQEARALVQGSSDRPWLVVDSQWRYVGKLNLARLWDALHSPMATDSGTHSTTPPAVIDPTAPLAPAAYPDSILLSYLGHELKTPLTSLLGLTSLLQREIQGHLAPRQVRYLTHIQAQTRRLTALVNGVLDLGRLAGGTLHLMPQILEVAPLCQEAYRQAQLVVGNPPPSADDPEPWAGPWPNGVLVADTLRLGQMVSYLLQLALRSNPPPTETLLHLEHWGDWTIFHPWSGGLALGSLPLTAGPLSAPAAESLGSGWLELLLTRHLAQAHGGELALTPHADGRLRPALLVPGGQESASAPDHWQAGQLALVVGQEPAVAIALGPPLRALGYYPLAVGTAPELQGAIPHLKPGVIVVSLLDSQGLSTLETLLQAPPSAPVITLNPAPNPGASTLPAPVFPGCSPLLWPNDHLQEALATALTTAPTATPLRPPTQRITILTLKAHDSSGSPPATVDVSSWLQGQGCQVLEVDDVDQAVLLSRVWRPDAVVVDPHLPHPDTYLQALSQFPSLANLPLITLTPEATAAGLAVGGLRLFPCGVDLPPTLPPSPASGTTQWLLAILRPAFLPSVGPPTSGESDPETLAPEPMGGWHPGPKGMEPRG